MNSVLLNYAPEKVNFDLGITFIDSYTFAFKAVGDQLSQLPDGTVVHLLIPHSTTRELEIFEGYLDLSVPEQYRVKFKQDITKELLDFAHAVVVLPRSPLCFTYSLLSNNTDFYHLQSRALDGLTAEKILRELNKAVDVRCGQQLILLPAKLFNFKNRNIKPYSVTMDEKFVYLRMPSIYSFPFVVALNTTDLRLVLPDKKTLFTIVPKQSPADEDAIILEFTTALNIVCKAPCEQLVLGLPLWV